MDKQQLRKIYQEKRKALSSAERESLGKKIAEHFAGLPFTGISYIHLFYPIAGKLEVDSLKLAAWLRQDHPEIKLVLPKSDLKGHSLQHIIWEEDTALAVNQWGITEPVDGEVIDSKLLDMILIPLLAYDLKGNRIGYGKGFYDRFLAHCRPDAIKIGLSFFPPQEWIEGTDPHDVPLDLCISPEKTWRFGP